MSERKFETSRASFLMFGREVFSRIPGWLSIGEAPKKAVRRFSASGHGVGIVYEIDFRGLVENHIEEIDQRTIDQCARQLLSDEIVRPQISDATTGFEVVDFERLKPLIVQRMLEPVIELIERYGPEVDEDRIVSGFDLLVHPTWSMFIPIVNLKTDAAGIRIGNLFELGPFTVYEKTALWDEHFVVQGDMITLRQFENANFRLLGQTTNANWTDLDTERELRRIITALRLLKAGRIGAPAIFFKGSMLSTFGGSVGSFADYGLHPATMLGLYPRYELRGSEVGDLLNLYESICRSDAGKPSAVLGVAVRRFNQAYTRTTREDRIIDFCIAMESSLLAGVEQELAHRLSLRGAALLAGKRHPESTSWLLRRIYRERSQIVHEGKSLPSAFERSNPFDVSLDDVCEDVVREILRVYISRLAAGESLKEINDELEQRIVLRLA